MIRRDFLKTSSIAAGSLFVPFSAWSNQKKIKLAVLGTGWWATEILIPAALRSGQFEIIGLCDVESNSLQNASEVVVKAGNVKPKLFDTYQEMFDMPGLEAVIISTPTHWHPLQFIYACRKGLHVYQEKPVSYDVREGQAMLKAKEEAKNVVQVSFPRVVFNTNDEVKKYLQSEEAGEIYQVKANINWPEGPVSKYKVPETLNYEKFVGPAPETPFVAGEEGGRWNWRSQFNFSKGIMMDWGIHYIHNLRKILDLGLPNSVSAIGGTIKNTSHGNPDYLDVKFDFDGLPVYWSHKTWGYKNPFPETDLGVFFYGDKATVFAGDQGWKVYSEDKSKQQTHGEIRFLWGQDDEFTSNYDTAFTGLFTNFAEGIRNRSNEHIINTLEDSEKTTACVLYGDMAYRSESNISIDTKSRDVIDNAKAAAYLQRTYRSPFKHPFT